MGGGSSPAGPVPDRPPRVTLPPAPPQFLLYCEGTRFTEKKHRVSMEVAASKGLPALKYHLLPRTKGFTTAVQCLRGTGRSCPARPGALLSGPSRNENRDLSKLHR